MRLVVVALALFGAFLFGPQVSVDARAPNSLTPARITVTELPDLPPAEPKLLGFASAEGARILAQPHAPVVALRSAQDGMAFTRQPTGLSMPVMPDLPMHLAELSPDLAPQPEAPSRRIVISTKDLAPLARPVSREETMRLGRVTASALNLRAGPAKGTAAVARLVQGTRLGLGGPSERGWIAVTVTETGAQGWVFARYVEVLQ